MLRHANAPTSRFTKVSNDLVRHPRLTPEAKLLLIYVQGLPQSEASKSLSEHAAKLNITGRAYQRAKELLLACGFFHHWREQGSGGRWFTDQLLANVTLTSEEASCIRHGIPPSAQSPTVGEPTRPMVGGSPTERKTGEKNTPHPPPKDAEVVEVAEMGDADTTPELFEAERVLLGLRHQHRDLYLGPREARTLATTAAEWLRRGITSAELRRALTAGLPAGGIQSAVGFLRHRLTAKLPAPAPLKTRVPYDALPPSRTVTPLVTCAGPGPDHAFRPLADETHCPRCRSDHPAAASVPRRRVPWRDLVATVAATH
ncbi:hypothetical protein J7I98_11755 [Streptomyces sp. ISL-98]|uniref:hypothetical protein n=1 Tax=Streptomyces sp. ISL-98 TaxID=2819192 RepID=UPI001BEB264F|nr:hypothetical protein [Streptomyces sp. ISL-98]MBT2506559.1 hypothetical protein [Streptomyces sp. ISL-98]